MRHRIKNCLKSIPRNNLVSALLQDREVLRLISAPHGFGKSVLAHEYAERIFKNGKVYWIDGRAPEFLQELDKGRLFMGDILHNSANYSDFERNLDNIDLGNNSNYDCSNNELAGKPKANKKSNQKACLQKTVKGKKKASKSLDKGADTSVSASIIKDLNFKQMQKDDADCGELVIIDDIPYLDEIRARTLSDCIDVLLYDRIEVIVTTLPSHDVLRFIQSDRLLLRAQDLLVTQEESDGQHPANTPEAQALRNNIWKDAQNSFLGLVPAVFFNRENKEEEAQRCLQGFFEEKLPTDILRSVFAMILLQKGKNEDLAYINAELSEEGKVLLGHDYAFLGIDIMKQCFDVLNFSLFRLRRCIDLAHIADDILGKDNMFLGKVLALLMREEKTERAGNILNIFYADEQCASWLSKEGWDLLDRGEYILVEKLFERCPRKTFANSLILWAMRSWTAGLLGDFHEAAFYAKRVLQIGSENAPKTKNLMLIFNTMNTNDASDCTSENANCNALDLTSLENRFAVLCSYLALVVFDNGGSAIHTKDTYSLNTAITSAASFFTYIVDTCTENEIELAFCLDKTQTKRRKQLIKQQKPMTKKRFQTFETLLTQGMQQFASSLWFRLALHFLHATNSANARILLQDCACVLLAQIRRKGLTRISEALLVCDLWESNYFGSRNIKSTQRDAALLENACKVLAKAGETMGVGALPVPWKLGAQSDTIEIKDDDILAPKTVIPLQMRFFGSFGLAIGEHALQEGSWRRKPRLMFTLIALRMGRDITRQEIIEQLWPNFDRCRAMDSFYNAWSNMNRVLHKGPYIERHGELCRLNQRFVKSDIVEFEHLTRALLLKDTKKDKLLDLYSQIEKIYSNGLLPSEHDCGFILEQQKYYRGLFVDAMVAGSHQAAEMYDLRLSLWFARKAYEQDPHNEAVNYALIRALIDAGQRSSALKAYEKCRVYLRENLGLDPSAELQDLYDRLVCADPALVKFQTMHFRQAAEMAL